MEKNQQYKEGSISKYSNSLLRLILATLIICCLLAQGRAQSDMLSIEGQMYVQQGASVYVLGDLQIEGATGELNNDGLIHIESDLFKSNNASYNDSGLGTLSFGTQNIASPTAQLIDGDFTGTNAIGNIIMGSPGANGIIGLKSGSLEVTNTLQLTDVILRTDNQSHGGDGSLYANELYISNPAPNALQLSANATNTYIEGKLRRAISAGNTYTFDIGAGMGEREPFELDFHTAPQNFNVLTYFQHQQDNSSDLNFSCGSTNYVADVSTGRWVTSPSQPTGYTYDVALMPGIGLMAQHNSTDNIIAEGGTLTQNCPDDTTLEAQNLNSLSYFDIIGVSPNLAIELERIWAEAAAKDINVRWTTASETNNLGFELQRSTDATNFGRIAWIDGQGNSSTSTDYKYTDTDVSEEVVYYYRIKSVETSGKEEYSPIVSASLGGDAIGVQVFPNPIRRYDRNLSLVAIGDGNSKVEIFNEAGQLMFSHQFQALNGEIINFVIPALAAGMHIVTMTNDEYTKRTKLLVAP